MTPPGQAGIDLAAFDFAYTGRPLDSATGLYDYRARWYDAALGRFASEDPIGLTGGDVNLYRYVGNSPANGTDPSGLVVVPGVLDDTVIVWPLPFDEGPGPGPGDSSPSPGDNNPPNDSGDDPVERPGGHPGYDPGHHPVSNGPSWNKTGWPNYGAPSTPPPSRPPSSNRPHEESSGATDGSCDCPCHRKKGQTAQQVAVWINQGNREGYATLVWTTPDGKRHEKTMSEDDFGKMMFLRERAAGKGSGVAPPWMQGMGGPGVFPSEQAARKYEDELWAAEKRRRADAALAARGTPTIGAAPTLTPYEEQERARVVAGRDIDWAFDPRNARDPRAIRIRTEAYRRNGGKLISPFLPYPPDEDIKAVLDFFSYTPASPFALLWKGTIHLRHGEYGEAIICYGGVAMEGYTIVRAGRASTRCVKCARPSTTCRIHAGRQGKHIPGHNNFIPGRSELTNSDPQALLNSGAGRGIPANRVPRGQPGFKERVDFGEIIGNYVDPVTGKSTPTTNGIIHYGKDGTAHIVPARPQ